MNTSTHSKGFSLVEALVAITILLVAIVGPMTIASQGLQASFFSREQTTAVYLAQEAIESIEKLRTNEALSGVDLLGEENWALCQNGITPTNGDCDVDAWAWFDDIESACKTADGCDVNTLNDPYTYHSCADVEDCRLNIANGAYSYASGDRSQFTRVIRLTNVAADQEVAVTVTVSWQANLFGTDASVVLQTRLFNQYEF